MDQTAVQEGTPPQKPLTTAIQAGPPGPKTERAPVHPARQVLDKLADLRITVALFVLALFLVFWGTLAQVDNGVWTVVQKYFRSMIVMVPLKVVFFNGVNTDLAIPYPGGWLIGGAMFVNLLAAHAVRFKLSWGRAGILLIHAGLIVMMVGELVTGLYAVEGNMIIKIGEAGSTVIHAGQSELAVIRRVDAKKDEVVVIPARFLKKSDAVIEHESLPFKFQVIEYMVNSNLKLAHNKLVTRGYGRTHIAVEQPEVSGVDPNQRHDQPSVYVKLTGKKGEDLGVWLFSLWFGEDVQWLEVDGVRYQILLRFKHTTRPFKLHLTDFQHKVFPGTNTPKDFHSYIDLADPETGVDRKVEIYMNSPLYYRGETFYQSSWTTDMKTGKADGTILQVVRNPGWLLPYISCAVVGIGMLIHFGLTLHRFIDKRSVR